MARITVTTDQGEVMCIIKDSEIGNLDKQMGRDALMIDIKESVDLARKIEKED